MTWSLQQNLLESLHFNLSSWLYVMVVVIVMGLQWCLYGYTQHHCVFPLYVVYRSASEYLDALDNSRIHPETYDWARKMAVDALEYEDVSL